MAHCINTNNPDFNILVEESGLNSMDLSARMGVWMENNNTEEWPTLEQLGIYNDIVKPGVDFVFEQNPELSEIGTKEQYSQYLDSIFPESKVRDIVYRRSPRANVEKFHKRERKEGYDQPGISSITKEYIFRIKEFGENLYTILVNIKNPYHTAKDYDLLEKGEGTQDEGYDGVISGGGEINVFEPEQIHILGSKQDIEGFKKYINSDIDITVSREQTPWDRKQEFIEQLKTNPDITLEQIENYIKGWNGAFSKKKFNGHYTILSEDYTSANLSRRKLAEYFIRDINRVIPGLLTAEEHPKYYRDDVSGNYLVNKDGSLAKKGVWYDIRINMDSISQYNETGRNEDSPLTKEEVTQLSIEFPTIVDNNLETIPLEFDEINNVNLDGASQNVSLIYKEAYEVDKFLKGVKKDEINSLLLLSRITSETGIEFSEPQRDLIKIIENVSIDLSTVTVKVVDRNELEHMFKDGLRRFGNSFGFTNWNAKTGRPTIYLIRDMLSDPGHGTFDTLVNTILHETIHSIVGDIVNNPSTESERILSNEINKLYNLAKQKTKFKDTLAYTNSNEFIAEVLGNNKLVEELKHMEFNWWQRFIRRIVEFFTGRKGDVAATDIPLNYYDSLFNSLLGYTKHYRKIKPVYQDVFVHRKADADLNFWIKGFTGKKTNFENAAVIRKLLNNGKNSYDKYRSKESATEETFISTEETLNLMNLGGTESELRLTTKDLSNINVNGAYKSIRNALSDYKGRVELTLDSKEKIIKRLENQFGEDSAVVTNAFVYNVDKKVYDIIDLIIIHTVDGSPVYSLVDFYETNGKLERFDKLNLPNKKTGVFKPMSNKVRQRIRIGFDAGTLRYHLGETDDYKRFVIPVNEDKNGISTVEGNLIEIKPTQLTSFLWADSFNESRAKAYDISSEAEIDISEAMEQWINEFSIKSQDETKEVDKLQKLLVDVVKSLNKRANVSKIYGNKITVVEIQKLMKDIVSKHAEPMEAIDAMILYSSKVLSNAREKLLSTDLKDNKINKNTLTAYKNMLNSFKVLQDINHYMISTFGSDIGNVSIKQGKKIIKGTKFRSELDQAIKDMGFIEIAYKERAINLLVEYLSPYYTRIKTDALDSYKRDYRLYNFRLKQGKGDVPSNFNKDLTEEEYVAMKYSSDSVAISNSTKFTIEQELTKGIKDVNYLEMLIDNILDTGDAVVGAYVKSLSVLDDNIRKETEQKREKYYDILQEFEKSLTSTGKVFTDFRDMYDFMLERDPITNKLTGHIVTKFRSDLLEERRQISIASEYYTDPKEGKYIRNAWLSENMPLNKTEYLSALWEYVLSLVKSGELTLDNANSIKEAIESDKNWIDIHNLVERNIISHGQGDKLYDWISKRQDDFREPSEEWANPQWEKLKKILDNPEDPRTKIYNAIVEMQLEADEMVPSSRAIRTALPGVVKQKTERISSGQNVVGLLKDSLTKTFTFQPDDTHRHTDITKEDGESLYFIPIHYNKKIHKKNEYDEWVFDEDNQSFDLFGIYFSYYSSAINYSKKHSILAETDMFRQLMRQRTIYKNGPTTKVLGVVKEKAGDILNLEGLDPATIVGGNISKMLDTWINSVVFGIQEKDLGKIPYTNIDYGKLIQALKKYTALNLLGLNVIQGVANVSLGEITQWIESIVKEYSDPKSYAKAHGDYMYNMPMMVADIGSRKPTNILSLIAQEFDIESMPNPTRLGKQSRTNNLSVEEFSHLTSSTGEHFMRVKFLDSMLYNKPAFDKDGKQIGSIRDFYTTEKGSGKLEFDKEGKVDLVKSQWTPTEQEDFKLKLESISGRMHGDYSNLAKVAIEQQAIGSLAYMFRRFVVPGVRRHFGKRRYETRASQYYEGMYTTTLKFIFEPAIAALKIKRGIESDISKLEALTWGERWATLSDHERKNIYRTCLEITTMLLITILLRNLKLKGDDDDSKLSYGDEFLTYQLLRLRSELMFYISPNQALKILRSPMASLSVFDNLGTLAQQVLHPLERYERGPWEGDLKIYKKFVNMVPIYRQLYRLRDVGEQIPMWKR